MVSRGLQFLHATPQPVVVGPYMSNFELFYYLIISNYYLATSYKYYRHPRKGSARGGITRAAGHRARAHEAKIHLLIHIIGVQHIAERGVPTC